MVKKQLVPKMVFVASMHKATNYSIIPTQKNDRRPTTGRQQFPSKRRVLSLEMLIDLLLLLLFKFNLNN